MIRRPLSRWSCRGFRASSPSSRPSRSKSATDGTSSVAISPRRGAMPSSAVPSSTGCAPSSPKATRRSSATAVSAAISRPSRPSTSPSTRRGSPKTRALTGSMCCAPTPSSPRFRSCCAIATYCGSSSCSARPRPCLPLAQSTTAWPPIIGTLAALRIDLVGTTADFRRPGPRHPLPLNHLPGENRGTAGRIGEVRLALMLWRELQLDQFWSKRLGVSRKGTHWDEVLFVLVAYRLLAPGSEWRLHREWFQRSALADLLGEDAGLAEIHKLYRCHDRLLVHKQAVFDHLVGRWRDLFNISYDVLLYDLTSTYFEADPPFPEGDKRRFGYSRDHRPDCVQIIIALVVTPEGLPLAYEVLPGNTVD